MPLHLRKFAAPVKSVAQNYHLMIPSYLSQLFKQQSYNPDQFFLIAGPCVVESEELVMEVADKVSAICKRLEIHYVL